MVDTCEKEIENFLGVRLQLQTDIFGENAGMRGREQRGGSKKQEKLRSCRRDTPSNQTHDWRR
jgi:hypothetical protein